MQDHDTDGTAYRSDLKHRNGSPIISRGKVYLIRPRGVNCDWLKSLYPGIMSKRRVLQNKSYFAFNRKKKFWFRLAKLVTVHDEVKGNFSSTCRISWLILVNSLHDPWMFVICIRRKSYRFQS